MPNWVYNNVVVNGTKEQILEMLNYGLKQDGKEPISSPDEVPNVKLSMESYVPMPQTYKDYDTTNNMPKRDAINWDTNLPRFNSDEEYAQYVENYKKAQTEQLEKYGVVGAKILDAEFDFGKFEKSTETDGWTISFDLDTAWAVPLPFYEKISKLFPMLEYEVFYEEEDCAFVGIFKFKNGEIIEKK